MTGHDAKTTLSFNLPEPRARLGIPLAPLIDIVFLLNCFFMLATELIQHQVDPRVELPRMTAPVTPIEAPAELTVNLRLDGLITVNGAQVPLREIPALLSGQAARSARAARPFRVVLRADRRQQFARLDEVLQACQEANLHQVVIRAREGDQP